MTVLQIPTERASALLAHHRQQMLALEEDLRESEGLSCKVIASNSAMTAGNITPTGLKKSLRAEALALRQVKVNAIGRGVTR